MVYESSSSTGAAEPDASPEAPEARRDPPAAAAGGAWLRLSPDTVPPRAEGGAAARGARRGRWLAARGGAATAAERRGVVPRLPPAPPSLQRPEKAAGALRACAAGCMAGAAMDRASWSPRPTRAETRPRRAQRPRPARGKHRRRAARFRSETVVAARRRDAPGRAPCEASSWRGLHESQQSSTRAMMPRLTQARRRRRRPSPPRSERR